MRISWLGHAMFQIFDESSGKTIITDPYAREVGYPLRSRRADILTVSHDHYDHNNISAVDSEIVLKGDTQKEIDGLKVVSLQTFHDEAGGSKRGRNWIFKFYGDTVLAHMGDFGEPDLRPEVEKFLSDVQVLLIPVGGTYTIGPVEALKIVEKLKPRIVIPMHYKTPYLKFEILGVESFIDGWSGRILEMESPTEMSDENMPEATTVVLLKLAI